MGAGHSALQPLSWKVASRHRLTALDQKGSFPSAMNNWGKNLGKLRRICG